jgi:uroporphyrin-III C-methyltransferase
MLTLTLEDLAAGEAQRWVDASQPSLLMIGEAFADRRQSVVRIVDGMLVAA